MAREIKVKLPDKFPGVPDSDIGEPLCMVIPVVDQGKFALAVVVPDDLRDDLRSLLATAMSMAVTNLLSKPQKPAPESVSIARAIRAAPLN